MIEGPSKALRNKEPMKKHIKKSGKRQWRKFYEENMEYKKIEDQVVNIFTKELYCSTFNVCRASLGWYQGQL